MGTTQTKLNFCKFGKKKSTTTLNDLPADIHRYISQFLRSDEFFANYIPSSPPIARSCYLNKSFYESMVIQQLNKIVITLYKDIKLPKQVKITPEYDDKYGNNGFHHFYQFKNYSHRGRIFNKYIKKYKI